MPVMTRFQWATQSPYSQLNKIMNFAKCFLKTGFKISNAV